MDEQHSKNDASFFLRSLKEEGVEEIYVEAGRSQKTASSTHSNTSSGVQPEKKIKSANPVTQSAVTQKKIPDQQANNSDPSVNEAMYKLRDQAMACTLCGELAATRNKVVFGAGNIKTQLMFVGEAPGRDEDEQGIPFVGAAGQLLTKIIESIGFNRDQVFIANTLKCRPPENRQPKTDEISNCSPFLQGQINLIQPKIICALGTFAAQTLLKTETPISKLRGKFWDLNENTRIVCTFHPAYLLRNPGEKRKVWEDMKMIKAELDRINL